MRPQIHPRTHAHAHGCAYAREAGSLAVWGLGTQQKKKICKYFKKNLEYRIF